MRNRNITEVSYFSTKTYVVGTQKSVSMKRFFSAPKHMIEIMGKKIFIILRCIEVDKDLDEQLAL